MHENLVFHIWSAIAYFYMLYLMIKMYPHVKEGYKHHYWLGFWMYSPISLDKQGQKIRRAVVIAITVYLVVAFFIARFS